MTRGLGDRRKNLDRLRAEYDHVCAQVREEEQALQEGKDYVGRVKQGQVVVQGVARSVQESAHQQISGIVTRCLRAVYAEEAFDFEIGFEEKRGKTEAVLTLRKDGMVLTDPLFETGGGVSDVAAFALRICSLLLSRPARRRLLVVDEPMKFLNGEEYQRRMGELLQTLAKETGIQMLIATDDPWLKVGKVIEL